MANRYDHGARYRGSAGNLADVAEGLGWFSIGLGVAEFVAPGQVGRMLGMLRSLLERAGFREAGFALNPDGQAWALLAVPLAVVPMRTEAGRGFIEELGAEQLAELVRRSWAYAGHED